MRLPSDIGGRLTEEVGFFQLDVEPLGKWLLGAFPGSRLRRGAWTSAEHAMGVLAPAVSESLLAIIPVRDWSVFLSNGPLGTDTGMLPLHVSNALACGTVRAVCAGKTPNSWPARILDVYEPDDGGPPRNRSIAATNDGGQWVFETSGTPFAFEDVAAYERVRERDRFSASDLCAYLDALDGPCNAEPTWGEGYVMELQPVAGPRWTPPWGRATR